MSNYFRVKTGLLLESAGAPTKTTQLKCAASLGTTYAITLPGALPAATDYGVMEVDSAGAASFTGSPTLTAPLVKTGLKVRDPAGTNYVQLQSTTMTGDYNLTLPAAAPGADSLVQCDSSGNLSFVTGYALDHTSLSNLTGGTYQDGGHTYLVQYHETTADPTATDDTTNYKQGALWLNTTSDRAFVNVDNTDSAAIWRDLSFANAANNSMKTYGYTFTLAADTVGPVNPSFSFVFTSGANSVFYARCKVIAIDPTNLDSVSTMVFDSMGGRLDAGVAKSIVVGSLSQISNDATVDFSQEVTTSATKITLTKTADLVTGNYTMIVHVDVVGGTLDQIYDETGAALIKQFSY